MSGTSGGGNGRRVMVNLAEARQLTPKVPAVEAMRQQLQLSLFGAVTEGDVAAMATKLKDMALEGDLKAMKLFFSLIDTKAAPPAQIVKIEQAVVQLQESMAQIQQAVIVQRGQSHEDEPKSAGLLPAPTLALPKSESKIAELERVERYRERAAQGLPLFEESAS